jgi:glycosyltransferase involved in cell wall biosynthesis
MEQIEYIIQPLVTLCIPTYNRSQFLEKCLAQIVCQKGFDERTEVVILDNCSTDNTKEIVGKFSERYSNIKYFRNSENIGMERNILKVLTLGNGQLLKLLNDYALLLEGALEMIISVVLENVNEKPNLYFSNKINKKLFYHFNDIDSFFKHTTYWQTWISTFAVWREDFNKLDNLTKYEGLLFPHLLIEIELVRNCESGISVNYIFSNDIQGATKGGYNFIDVFVGNYVGKILTPLYKNKELSLRTLVFVKSSFLIKFIKVWLLNIKVKKNNNFAIDNNKLLFRYFKFYPQLYYVYFYIHTYPYFNYIKLNLKSIFNKN